VFGRFAADKLFYELCNVLLACHRRNNSDVFAVSADIMVAAHCLIFMNCEAAIETEFLVIGYGNTLRGDDGIGPRVAEAVGHLRLPGVRTLICPLLTPELADPISRAGTVIFVDAAVDAANEVQWRKLEPNETSQLMAHAADPRTMLALARDVFGRAPEAWWLTIPAVDLGFCENFSPEVRKGFAEAMQKIQAFCRSPQMI
jgi:hydrogenase maturation protease